MTSPAGFDARLVHTDHEAAVVVHGEIDIATCGRLWPVMEQAISLGPRLVLDLAETTYIDSCGLALIVRAHRLLGQPRGAVLIRSPGPAARKLFSTTGVDRLVTMIIALAPNDALFEKTASNIMEAAARGGKVLLLSDAKGVERMGAKVTWTVTLPEVHAFVAPILYAIPMQLLAYHTAVIKGTDVDQPRNLAKSVMVE